MQDRRGNIERPHRNTCQWVLGLPEYKEWKEQARGLLWIKGKPGAGKSTLMAFLHEHLEPSSDSIPGIQLDFFFAARGVELQKTPLGMLRALLVQIFSKDKIVRPQVRDFYLKKRTLFGGGQNGWQWPEPELERLLKSAILTSATQRTVAIFVDALDEAGAKSAQKLARYFHELNDEAEQSKSNLKIYISCRHYPVPTTRTAREITVESHNGEDIASYFRDVLSEEIQGTDNQSLINKLTKQARNMFLWAHTILPFIVERLSEGDTPKHICDWLDELPIALEGMEETWQYIIERVIREENRNQSFLFFQWVYLAMRPLTVKELRYALALRHLKAEWYPRSWQKVKGFISTDEHMKQKIKALSGGLAEWREDREGRETVQFVHQSVNDFLCSRGLALIARLCKPICFAEIETLTFQCQATLYQACLSYIATESPKISQYTNRTDLAKSPFIKYATDNIFWHAENARGFRTNALKEDVQNLERIFPLWRHIIFILGNSMHALESTSLMHVSVRHNLVDVIEALASQGRGTMESDSEKNTPMHLAAQLGNLESVKLLKQLGADFLAKNDADRTPILLAARSGHLTLFKWLLCEEQKIRPVKFTMGTSLGLAAANHRIEIVQFLLGEGADVNAPSGEDLDSALLGAASLKHNPKVVKILLNAGANANARAPKDGPALYRAVLSNRNSETITMLLDAGADVNAPGKDGTALYVASLNGYTENAKVLLNAGADVNCQGGLYHTALQAASFRGHTDIVKELLNAGADVNCQGGLYHTALQAASYDDYSEIFRYENERAFAKAMSALDDLKLHTDYENAIDKSAHERRVFEAIGDLLQAHLHIKDPSYVNDKASDDDARRTAPYDRKLEIIKMLLHAGADVNAHGGKYGSALNAAASFRRNIMTLVTLLGAGAELYFERRKTAT